MVDQKIIEQAMTQVLLYVLGLLVFPAWMIYMMMEDENND